MLFNKISHNPIVKKTYVPPTCKLKTIPKAQISGKNLSDDYKIVASDGSVNIIATDGHEIAGTYFKKKTAYKKRKKQFLPENWFETDKQGKKHIKPFLWVNLIMVYQKQKGMGYGKKLLQELYEKSLEQGCEGRMMLFSAWDSYGFYAKTGWEIFANTEKRCQKTEKKIDLCTKIKNKILKSRKTPLLDRLTEYYSKNLCMLKAKLPYQDEEILFNPTEENVKKLFS